ncbi:hypothetical protein BJ170DRAFT_475687 [Xylariales sp. AK1849]|nr:hypothetical protein BJ170DRAFT_475687 [Xylariales sp. AK1849]
MFTTFSSRMSPVRTTVPSRITKSGRKDANLVPWQGATHREIERLHERLTGLIALTPSSPSAQSTRRTTICTRSGEPTEQFTKSGDWNVPDRPGSYQGLPENEGSPVFGLSPLLRRMSQYLEQSSGEPYPVSRLEPRGQWVELGASASENGPEFSQSKERYLLDLLQSEYHFASPLPDADELQAHHDSLWKNNWAADSNSPPTRMPSALIDILLALTMQFSSSGLLREGPGSARRTVNPQVIDSSRAGLWLYHRSRRCFFEEQHKLTLRSVQTLMVTAFYIVNAGSWELASTVLAEGVRRAQVLRLHEEPSSLDANLKQRNRRLHVWRKLVMMDSYLALVAGLPPLVSAHRLTPNPPRGLCQGTVAVVTGNSTQTAMQGGFEECLIELIMIAQIDFLPYVDVIKIDTASMTLESISVFTHKREAMQQWTDSVPQPLRLHRTGTGKPMSFTDGSDLDLDAYAPIRLQRQRLSLEIIYHHVNLLFLRPLLGFEHQNTVHSAQLDAHSIAGLKHAMSVIYIMDLAFTGGDILTWWLFGFQCQWDATLTTLGFILARADHPTVIDAQRAVRTAVKTFTIMSQYLDSAKRALCVIQDVLDRSPMIENALRDRTAPGGQTLSSGTSLFLGLSPPPSPLGPSNGNLSAGPKDSTVHSSALLHQPQDLTWATFSDETCNAYTAGIPGSTPDTGPPSVETKADTPFFFYNQDGHSILDGNATPEDWQSILQHFPPMVDGWKDETVTGDHPVFGRVPHQD